MRLIEATHDDFPLETIPPQGTITLIYSNGKEIIEYKFVGFEREYNIFYDLCIQYYDLNRLKNKIDKSKEKIEKYLNFDLDDNTRKRILKQDKINEDLRAEYIKNKNNLDQLNKELLDKYVFNKE